jgi:hypothetical protein
VIYVNETSDAASVTSPSTAMLSGEVPSSPVLLPFVIRDSKGRLICPKVKKWKKHEPWFFTFERNVASAPYEEVLLAKRSGPDRPAKYTVLDMDLEVGHTQCCTARTI